ncbi:hypothetical protein F5Y10DRAFT_292726 [Nemania abortiva]|nr:hypothetical protein F5Y10DRAFT_292726 [Nemania abortiva]
MPRGRTQNRLQADIQAASHETIPHIQRVGKGDVEDEFVFTFSHPQVPQGKIEIRVMPQETAGYPGDNYFLVPFYTDDGVPSNIGNILDSAMTSTAGMRIADLLRTLSCQLCNSLEFANESEDSKAIVPDADVYTHSSEESDESDADIPFDYDDDDSFGFSDSPQHIVQTRTPDQILERVRQDFRTVRNTGIRISKISGVDYVSEHNIMAMSVKASKLGLSEEAYLAWNLGPSDYLILLMRYSGDYTSFEDAMGRPAGQIPICFRLRKCSKYRPKLEEAIAAFSSSLPNNHSKKHEQKIVNFEDSLLDGGDLSTFGVGDSIELLFNNSFFAMMKLRRMKNISWDRAKKILSEVAISGCDNESIMTKASEPDSANLADKGLPPILINDHLLSEDMVSLPLVAMQFALRYLVKCTDYCMICHEKTTGTFEALKPYVCSNPLCLFQYMSLGLGPSIDNEIIHQPDVVDLLISFCYASLQRAWDNKPKLRQFPIGLSLEVPCIRKPGDNWNKGTLINPLEIEVSWSDSKATIIDKSHVIGPSLKVGQWVVIHTDQNYGKSKSGGSGTHILHYARIEDKTDSELWLHIATRHPVLMGLAGITAKYWSWENIGPAKGQLVLCNRSLDDIEDDEEKAFLLTLLLSALPSVGEMRSHLVENNSRQLAAWNRIPPSAMKLLRWIIASNRSFIVRVNDSPINDVNLDNTTNKRPDRSREKISGVDGWIQFRFAQGSPEKEALFLDALKDLETSHRTILAWHGSPIGNWHSIIREGLDFKVVANARAYGDGVYFSRSFDYSIGYSKRIGSFIWPQSSLEITEAISLNELVNLPHKFRHSNNNIYVVDILHWIQCRYLFVRPKQQPEVGLVRIDTTRHTKVEEFEQDPKYAILGPQSGRVFVPKLAIPSVKKQQHHDPSPPTRRKIGDDDTDEEDINDINFLVDAGNARSSTGGPKLLQTHSDIHTDFRPGSLDFSQLPQLARPSYATKSAQQIIQRELQKLEKIQSTTPLHELGWYIDLDKVENMFQWIVELHSFDPSLPLAQDMKAAGVTSIVLEIRFLRGFPVSPPFIRVVRPRFRLFAMGGGGHVTAGGAMCMELLTNTGWSPVSSMESVLLQVRMAICSLEPKPARLEETTSSSTQYGITEAVDAYTRAATMHGWEIPAELKEAIILV